MRLKQSESTLLQAMDFTMCNAASLSPDGLRAVVELAPDGIFVADVHGRFTYVNAAACRMIGCSREEVIGQSVFDFIAREDIPRLLQAKSRMLEGRTDVGEWRLRRKDGSWLAVEVHANILPGGPLQAFVRDISAREAQRAERDALFKQMERDRLRLDAVMDTLPVGVVLFEPDGKTFSNRHAEQVVGVKMSADDGGSPVGRIFYPDGRAVPADELPSSRAMEKRETILAAEYLVRRGSGTDVPILVSAAPIVTEDGRFLGGVGVCQDVSERMQLERAVRENERLLNAVFDLLPVGVWVADRTGRIVSNNPAAETIWQGAREVSAEPARDREHRAWWLETGLPIGPEDWGLTRAVRRGETSRRELIRIQCFDGSFKTMINWAAPIRSESGEITGAVAINEDVTALQETQEQLRDAVRDREQILAVVAHDLRTPLSGLMLRAASAEQKAQKIPGAEELRSTAASIAEIARGMAGMVDDLLAISVGGPGHSMVKFSPVHSAALLAKAAEAAQPLLAEEGFELAVEQAGELPLVHADERRILRVFANLFDNALKFTERGGRIVVRAEAAPDAVRFSVANSGPALDQDDMDRLFQPFWQAGREDRRGAGLGLSICRAIIEGHGGRVWTESAEGMRVQVCFLLYCDGRRRHEGGQAPASGERRSRPAGPRKPAT